MRIDADGARERPNLASRMEAAPTPEPQEGAPTAPEAADAAPPSADIQSYIGAQLRAVYDHVASQPVPDRFLDLMKRLG